MTNKNYVTITPNCFYGYINDSTPSGKAKVEQVKAYMEILAMMLQDTNLSPATKKAIYADYANKIREYVEREDTCCSCTDDCDCECECEEEEYEYEEEEELTIEDMERYSISFGKREEIGCDSYSETVDKVGALLELGYYPNVFGYDNEGKSHSLNIFEGGEGIYLEITE